MFFSHLSLIIEAYFPINESFFVISSAKISVDEFSKRSGASSITNGSFINEIPASEGSSCRGSDGSDTQYD